MVAVAARHLAFHCVRLFSKNRTNLSWGLLYGSPCAVPRAFELTCALFRLRLVSIGHLCSAARPPRRFPQPPLLSPISSAQKWHYSSIKTSPSISLMFISPAPASYYSVVRQKVMERFQEATRI